MIYPRLRFVYTRPASDLRTVESFPGAACFCTFRPEWYCDEIREGGEMSAKAAPLQALGNRPLPQRATRSIEDEANRKPSTAYPTRLIVQSGWYLIPFA
jgi:hypothetical protein